MYEDIYENMYENANKTEIIENNNNLIQESPEDTRSVRRPFMKGVYRRLLGEESEEINKECYISQNEIIKEAQEERNVVKLYKKRIKNKRRAKKNHFFYSSAKLTKPGSVVQYNGTTFQHKPNNVRFYS